MKATSTWTSKGTRTATGKGTGKALVLALAACLPACVPAGGATRSATILDGAVRLGVPAGYCIDQGAGSQGDDSAVVILGKCRADGPAAPAVISLTVGPAGSGQVLAAPSSYLAGYFMSESGRAAMASDGRAGSVTVETAKAVGPAIMLRLVDRRLGRYWRGVEAVGGRAVTVSVTAAAPEAAEAVLTATLAAMRQVAGQAAGQVGAGQVGAGQADAGQAGAGQDSAGQVGAGP